MSNSPHRRLNTWALLSALAILAAGLVLFTMDDNGTRDAIVFGLALIVLALTIVEVVVRRRASRRV